MNIAKTRREFVRDGLALTGALAAAPAFAEQDKKPTVILSCETYSLRDLFGKGKLTLEQVPALYRDLDIQGISWNDMFFKSWDTDYLGSLKRAAKDAGRTTTCLIMEGNLAHDDLDKRKKQVEEDMKKMKAASFLGAPVVRVNLGGTGRDADDDVIGVQRCVTALKEMLPLAKELKIKMTIENHGGCSKTADRILKVIDGTDPEWVGSCLDFGNWPNTPPNLKYDEIGKLVGHAYHTHAKTHNFLPNGEERDLDYKKILGMLKRAQYSGAISIEWEGDYPVDQVEGVKLTRNLVRKYWKGV